MRHKPSHGHRSRTDHDRHDDHDHNHEHDDHEHDDHDHDYAPGPIEENPLWLRDNVRLRSVGIDIGSSGTQVVISRLHLRRQGERLASRYVVVERTALYRSPIAFTPYRDDGLIDAARLSAVIDRAYRGAGFDREEIDTGAVIMTGEAVRRRNARAIADVVSDRAGEFVCASAGHRMEATLAAHGSGAVRASADSERRILNIDIGGGTTKFALVGAGRVEQTAALHVGGRLHVLDGDGRLIRLEPAGQAHARRAGVSWSLGGLTRPADLDHVANAMVGLVVDAVRSAVYGEPVPPAVAEHYLTEPLGRLGRVDGLMFSGGVAEYVYRRESRDFGDLGRRVGAALRHRIDVGDLGPDLLPASERICATVVGASEYTVQLSGNTTYISDPERLLPRRNLRVLRPEYRLEATIDPAVVAGGIRRHLAAFDVTDSDEEVVLALAWSGLPSHERLYAFATGVARGLADRTAGDRPIYLALDGDVALSLGAILREELRVMVPVVVIDGLDLVDFDFIDLGGIRMPSLTVPVTIKSLIFNEFQQLR